MLVGFFGNPEPELLVRWYQVGAYYPFFRAHAHQYTKRREPCLFGERNTELMREAIHVRYMYLPYFYTLFREANMTGTPVLRPLWIEFPADEETFSNDEAFIVGNSLLVQGIYTEVVAYLMVTSMAGLGQIVYLAYNGDQKITWSEACSSYGKFCNRLKLILAFQFLALSCFLLLAIISAYRLFSRFDPPILPSKDAEEEQN